MQTEPARSRRSPVPHRLTDGMSPGPELMRLNTLTTPPVVVGDCRIMTSIRQKAFPRTQDTSALLSLVQKGMVAAWPDGAPPNTLPHGPPHFRKNAPWSSDRMADGILVATWVLKGWCVTDGYLVGSGYCVWLSQAPLPSKGPV